MPRCRCSASLRDARRARGGSSETARGDGGGRAVQFARRHRGGRDRHRRAGWRHGRKTGGAGLVRQCRGGTVLREMPWDIEPRSAATVRRRRSRWRCARSTCHRPMLRACRRASALGTHTLPSAAFRTAMRPCSYREVPNGGDSTSPHRLSHSSRTSLAGRPRCADLIGCVERTITCASAEIGRH